MARKPAPTYAPIDPGPAELTDDELFADGVLPMKDAAAFCGVRRSTMCKMVAAGTVPSRKVGKLRVIPKRALVAYLKKCPR